MPHIPDDVTMLAAAQRGLIARRQLGELGVDRFRIRTQLRAKRWVERSATVISTATGELTWEQRVWLGVLHAGGRALVGGLTALELHGLKNWHRDDVTVLVGATAHLDPVDGVSFVRTRRPLELWRSSAPGLPLARVEPAALLWAAYEPSERAAQGLLAAVVQQQLAAPASLERHLELMWPLRRGPLFREVLVEISGGASSLGEIDVLRMCRTYGLPTPRRQVRRKDSAGRVRYTDCEWVIADGTVVILEVDGAFHMDVAHWEADMQRERRLATPGRVVLRCTTRELRDEGFAVAADLQALGLGQSCA